MESNKPTEPISADTAVYNEATKKIRSILNKVSEGNIDPMFKELSEVLD